MEGGGVAGRWEAGWRGGSAHHALQINEPVPICHGKALHSQDIHRGEANHLRVCGTTGGVE